MHSVPNDRHTGPVALRTCRVYHAAKLESSALRTSTSLFENACGEASLLAHLAPDRAAPVKGA